MEGQGQGPQAGEQVTKARVLYHIMWPGYTAEAATWEPVENVGLALLEEYEEGLRLEAEAEAAEAAELADSDDEESD